MSTGSLVAIRRERVDYEKRRGCDAVIEARKGYCWAEPEAWGIPVEKTCELCRTLNFRIFVEAETESKKIGEKVTHMPDLRRTCHRCQSSSVMILRWINGEVYCYECERIVRREYRFRSEAGSR